MIATTAPKTDYTETAEYIKETRCIDVGGGVLEPGGCKLPKQLNVGHRLPGTIIVIHGVNDVGGATARWRRGCARA